MTIQQLKFQRPQIDLRKWQAEAKAECIGEFAAGKKVWVQETVTGGGKTVFGRETALDLYESEAIDLILILVPSIAVQSSWINSFRGSLNATAGPNYQSDTQVWVGTYSGYKALCNALAVRRTKGYLLIADEYHHAEREASWGQGITMLGKHAAHVLMLSATPWRTLGTIALLENERNINDRFYYGEDGKVEPDHRYSYSDDLQSETRGTVPVRFTFETAKATDEDTGVCYELDVDPDNWREFIDENCKEPLGKYVSVVSKKRPSNPRLEGKEMHQNLIAKGLQSLEVSRSEIARACGVPNVSIMHVACANINDAASVELYINTYCPGVKAEKIVNEDPKSSKRIEEIQRACRKGSLDRPDVIISVNMISEGVDIPAIKVTVYFGRIMTLLYMIQLIGRGQRRIWLDEIGDYADDNNIIDQTPSYFLAPAHPYIMWMASEIERDIKQARKALGLPTTEGKTDVEKKERHSKEYNVQSTGKTLHIYRCEGVGIDKIKLMAVTDALIDHPMSKKYGVNTMWGNYINSLITDGIGELAESEIKNKCQLVGIDFDTAASPAAVKGELNYDEHSKMLSEEADGVIKFVRNNIEPFKGWDDDAKAYAKAWHRLNRIAGIKSFAKATLEEKEKWLNAARAWQAEQLKIMGCMA